MALQTEKINDELFTQITTLQSELTDYIFDIGQYDLQLREFSDKLKIVERMKDITHQKYSDKYKEFNTIIDGLDKTYPNVKLDLEQRILTYEK